MSDNGQGPRLGNVVENGSRMVARGCQGSPEVSVDLNLVCSQPWGWEGPPMARSDEIASLPLINSGVGGMAQPFNVHKYILLCKLLQQIRTRRRNSSCQSSQCTNPL